MGNASICTPLLPASPVYKEPKMDIEHDEQWKNIRAIIAAIAIPKKSTSESISQDTTPVDDTASLLLPKVVDSAASEPQSGNAYGTFNRTAEESEHTVVPLHPNSILTSAALTPVYLILMLLPMLPFWIFAGFLCYVAATSPISETQITFIALAFLLPFNTVGTIAVIRFAMNERQKAVRANAGEGDVEIGSVTRRSSGSSGSGSEKRRLWRPSMSFVLHGARREGRRL